MAKCSFKVNKHKNLVREAIREVRKQVAKERYDQQKVMAKEDKALEGVPMELQCLRSNASDINTKKDSAVGMVRTMKIEPVMVTNRSMPSLRQMD